MNIKLLLAVLVDTLYKSGLDIDIDAAHEYLKSIPGYTGSVEEYEKWKKKETN